MAKLEQSGLRKLIGNKLYRSLFGVILVGCAMVAYLIPVVLDTPLLSRPDKITVVMPMTGGLYEGSSVTVRGVKVGKVSDIHLNDEGEVEADIIITDTMDIPANSVVKVRSLSPVGEQYLDFQPPSKEGPFLEDGDRIKAKAADLPKTLASTVINVNKVLKQLDKEDLHTALVGIGEALAGTGDDIGKLADQGYELLKVIDENFPTIDRLLINGNTLLRIGANNAENVETLATSSRQFAAFLRAFDPRLRKLLKTGPGQLKDLQEVIAAVDEVLPAFLDRTIKVTNLVKAREPHFRELLRAYSAGINGLGSILASDHARVYLLLQADYRCFYNGTHYSPRDATRHPTYWGGHCLPPDNRLVRGSQNAPGPIG